MCMVLATGIRVRRAFPEHSELKRWLWHLQRISGNRRSGSGCERRTDAGELWHKKDVRTEHSVVGRMAGGARTRLTSADIRSEVNRA